MVRDYVISDNDVLGNVKKNLIKYEIMTHYTSLGYCFFTKLWALIYHSYLCFRSPKIKLERSLHRYYSL